MEDTVNQIYILIVCLFSGILGGVLYEPFYLFRRLINKRAAGIIADILFFLLFAGIFVLLSVIYDFPQRGRICLWVRSADSCCTVSLHRILAFLTEKLYNSAKKLILRIKRNFSGKRNERRKV